VRAGRQSGGHSVFADSRRQTITSCSLFASGVPVPPQCNIVVWLSRNSCHEDSYSMLTFLANTEEVAPTR
jgi:hypothetical protein